MVLFIRLRDYFCLELVLGLWALKVILLFKSIDDKYITFLLRMRVELALIQLILLVIIQPFDIHPLKVILFMNKVNQLIIPKLCHLHLLRQLSLPVISELYNPLHFLLVITPFNQFLIDTVSPWLQLLLQRHNLKMQFVVLLDNFWYLRLDCLVDMLVCQLELFCLAKKRVLLVKW